MLFWRCQRRRVPPTMAGIRDDPEKRLGVGTILSRGLEELCGRVWSPDPKV